MTTNIIRVDDDTTRDDIATALVNEALFAARQQHHLDNAKWNNAHARIDALLTDWQAAH